MSVFRWQDAPRRVDDARRGACMRPVPRHAGRALRRVAAVARYGLAVGALAVLSVSAWAQPLTWFDDLHPRPQASQMLALLQAADADGLEPGDYGLPALARGFETAAAAPLSLERRTQLDAALTRAAERFLRDLHLGRVDPRAVHASFRLPRRSFDAAAVLRDALAADRLPGLAHAVAPDLKLYAGLRRALAEYRALGAHAAWRSTLPALPGGKVEPGQAYAGLAVVASRLRALGDLPDDSVPSDHLDGPLVGALRSFQRRHGLDDDGVLGRATRAALEVPPAQRAQQIVLALERLRWTPLLQGPRMIVVNVPEFVLRAYEVRDGQPDVQVEMKVIVGRALETRTPLINEDLRYIEFSPYWNVPPSIATKETVPRLRRDPGYFDREGFEFVTAGGQVVAALDGALLEDVLRGEARIRQRPGPANALGDIKFVFPNNESIYLHHTPTPRLFERERRDFSHGCIRIEDPVALARFVLRDQPEWTEARIREAMAQGSSRTIRLSQPVPVLIAYGTALVIGGRPHFFNDLYGHDRTLAQALRRRPATAVIQGMAAPAR